MGGGGGGGVQNNIAPKIPRVVCTHSGTAASSVAREDRLDPQS